jgi:hypothetical protein
MPIEAVLIIGLHTKDTQIVRVNGIIKAYILEVLGAPGTTSIPIPVWLFKIMPQPQPHPYCGCLCSNNKSKEPTPGMLLEAGSKFTQAKYRDRSQDLR